MTTNHHTNKIAETRASLRSFHELGGELVGGIWGKWWKDLVRVRRLDKYSRKHREMIRRRSMVAFLSGYGLAAYIYGRADEQDTKSNENIRTDQRDCTSSSAGPEEHAACCENSR